MIQFILMILISCSLGARVVSAATPEEPTITKWYKNYDAAVSLRFDDNHESHLQIAIPLLNANNIKATFMVNPGRRLYEKHKEYWENRVPQMGHRLGNHTMNHSGARDIEEAEYEIGETTRILRKVNSSASDLMVFASGGGGKTWGGKKWEEADSAYHLLVDKYKLIDLYDGNHPSVSVKGSSQLGELCDRIDKTVEAKDHQPFHFHNIGKSSLTESVKNIIRGYSLSVSETVFSEFIKCIDERRERLWVAPLIDILKYEEARKGATLATLNSDQMSHSISLSVQTDPSLYNHDITMQIPEKNGLVIKNVLQNDQDRLVYKSGGVYFVNVEPVNSIISIDYQNLPAKH